jgi:hypothetical protein
MGAAPLEYLAPLQAGAQLVREVLAIYREQKASRGGAPQEAEEKLQQAEEQLDLAKAVAAKDLGYRLCRCTFPPQIMTVIRVDDGMEHWGCSNCGREQAPDDANYSWISY